MLNGPPFASVLFLISMTSTFWEVSQPAPRLFSARALTGGAVVGAVLSSALAAGLVQAPLLSVVRALVGRTPVAELSAETATWAEPGRFLWKSEAQAFAPSTWVATEVPVETPVRVSHPRSPLNRVRPQGLSKSPASQSVLAPAAPPAAPAWVASLAEESGRIEQVYTELRSRFVRLAHGERVDDVPRLIASSELEVRSAAPERASLPSLKSSIGLSSHAKSIWSGTHTKRSVRLSAASGVPEGVISHASTESAKASAGGPVSVPQSKDEIREEPRNVAIQARGSQEPNVDEHEPHPNPAQVAAALFSLDSDGKEATVHDAAGLVTTQAAPALFVQVTSRIQQAMKSSGPQASTSLHPRPIVVATRTEASASVDSSLSGSSPVALMAETESSDSSSSDQATPAQVNPWIATEGFAATQQDVAIQKVRQWAGEGFDSNSTRATWVLNQAPGYLDTLEYSARAALVSGKKVAPTVSAPALPLISENSLRFLAASASVTLNPSLGVVIARTVGDWHPLLSGGTTAPLELGEDRSALPRGLRVAREKTWIWFNVAPGFQVVRLSQPTGKRGFASLPVVAGTLTWMDVSEVRFEGVKGQVYSASAARAQPIRGAEVRVPGDAVAVATTDTQGRFTLKDWVRLGEHPIDLEVWTSRDYPNRYRLFPESGQVAPLFFFTAEAVQVWSDQLQGGLSSAGGIVIGAPGEYVARQSGVGEAVYPEVRTLSSSPMLQPETYTLSAQDQLLVHRALDPYAPRYLGVQLPEGPIDIALLNQEGTELRRELVISSPGVVNVVSPR